MGTECVPVLPSQHANIRTDKAFQAIKELVAGYLAVSVLTLAAIIVMRNHPHDVNSAVWTRGVIVVASAALTLLFTIRAAGGSRRSYLRLRIISTVMPFAIAVIIAWPGTFPAWMKVEQGVCGLLLIAIAVMANGKHLRCVFGSH
jgi:hypothetical protein